MLSALADAKVNSFGCMHIARTDFLWCVRVVIVLPATSKGLFQGTNWKIVSRVLSAPLPLLAQEDP
eukprot:9486282-Pyramimonas_sp.AAC.1